MKVVVLYRNGRTRVFDGVSFFWLRKRFYHITRPGHDECIPVWRVRSFDVN